MRTYYKKGGGADASKYHTKKDGTKAKNSHYFLPFLFFNSCIVLNIFLDEMFLSVTPFVALGIFGLRIFVNTFPIPLVIIVIIFFRF